MWFGLSLSGMALKFQKNPHHNPAPVVSHFTWQRAGRSEENDGK